MGDFELLFLQFVFEATAMFSRFSWRQAGNKNDLPDVGQRLEEGATHRQLLLCQQGSLLHVEVR